MKSLKNNQLYRLILCRFAETVREPEVLFWGIIFPVLISIGLGLAFTQNNESKFNILCVGTQGTELDSLLTIYGEKSEKKGKETFIWKVEDATLGNTTYHFIHSDWDNAIISLKRGESDIIVTDSLSKIGYHFDPNNAQAQLAYMKLSALVQSPTRIHSAQPQISPLTLKGVRYIDFFIPGLIAFGLMSSLLWGISYTIIECRSQRLLRRLIASPMRKSNYLIAIMFVRIVMNVAEALILLFFAWLLFDVYIQGSIGAFALLFVAGNVAFTGVAVLLSCRTSKTESGTGLINLVQMPMMLLSGIFFSYHNFPEWSIGAIKLLPLTALADGFRAIFNEGAGWLQVATPTAALFVLGAVCFVAGMRWFKWQ
ncbi:MAG: ABC transporter permease [Bacteroidales bacterium]|nr:ABC transporter permease [Bacteroidales bacterium]